MEAFTLYLFKSVLWLSGFTLVFLLFLRNERFFFLNRIYLVSGILTSFFFPLVSVHYTLDLPVEITAQAGNVMQEGYRVSSHSSLSGAGLLLSAIYLSGVLFVVFMIIRQSKSVLKTIKKAEIIISQPVKLIRTTDYTSSFSFFSYVFVNPSVSDVETEEIVNHEMVHIRQMHWVDLVLVELLCILQWFNPFIWIYFRFIRQNHEYLADEVSLQQTSDPAFYRATLLNQITGYPVVSLANSFNYSLNKKRFIMMKNIISSPYRKIKILCILPVFAIILYSFAKPEYRYAATDNSANISPLLKSQKQEIKGTVMQQDGKPLHGATFIIKGTTTGTISDEKGHFSLNNVPGDALLVVSYVGFKTKVLEPVFNSEMIIQMIRDTINLSSVTPPPPPPQPPFDMKGTGTHALIVLDGKVTNIDINKIDPTTIGSVNVLKGEEATKKYGEKGKDGVIEITSKKDDSQVKDQETNRNLFTVVEEMPQFPGGSEALMAWISASIKYPEEAVKKHITGQVLVKFTVSINGKILNVKVNQPVNPLLDAEAIRVVSNMPDWKPGRQGGKPVDVYMKMPVNFALK
jgi:TonB family protein